MVVWLVMAPAVTIIKTDNIFSSSLLTFTLTDKSKKIPLTSLALLQIDIAEIEKNNYDTIKNNLFEVGFAEDIIL